MSEIRKPKPYQLAADEKTTLVLVYTANSLIRGEVISKAGLRISIWLRMQGAPEYIHLLKAHVLVFGGGGPARQMSFSELIVPTAEVVAFHLAPPGQDPMDYDETEANRVMVPISILVGSFHFDGHMRLSSQSDVATNLNALRSPWLSLYELEIGNPNLPGMGILKVPMTLVRPLHVMIGSNTETPAPPTAS